MELVFHLGAHSTDHRALLKLLRTNAATLARHGIEAPDQDRFRPILREAVKTAAEDPAPDTGQIALDAIAEHDHTRRTIFINEHFLGVPARVIVRGRFYPGALDRLQGLRRLFADLPMTFNLTVRNPATLVPAIFDGLPDDEFRDFFDTADMPAALWSDLVRRIREAFPEVPINVTAYEDLPLAWTRVVSALTGLEDPFGLEQLNAYTGALMEPGGLERMENYMEWHPPESHEDWRKIAEAFLDRYLAEDAASMEVTLPGWTGDWVAALTAAYEDDLERIAAMADVNFIAP